MLFSKNCYFIEVKNIKATPTKQDHDSPWVYFSNFRRACSFVFLPWESQAYGLENCLQLLTDMILSFTCSKKYFAQMGGSGVVAFTAGNEVGEARQNNEKNGEHSQLPKMKLI